MFSFLAFSYFPSPLSIFCATKHSKAFYWLSRMPLYEVYNLFWQFPIFGYLDWIIFSLTIKMRLQWIFLNINLPIILPISVENHPKGNHCVDSHVKASESALQTDFGVPCHCVGLHDARFYCCLSIFSIFLITNHRPFLSLCHTFS